MISFWEFSFVWNSWEITLSLIFKCSCFTTSSHEHWSSQLVSLDIEFKIIINIVYSTTLNKDFPTPFMRLSAKFAMFQHIGFKGIWMLIYMQCQNLLFLLHASKLSNGPILFYVIDFIHLITLLKCLFQTSLRI